MLAVSTALIASAAGNELDVKALGDWALSGAEAKAGPAPSAYIYVHMTG